MQAEKTYIITLRGGNAPTYLDRIITDHYRSEDMKLSGPR